MYEGLDRHR